MPDRRSFLKMAACVALSKPLPHESVSTIEWNREACVMDGFGASAAFHMANNLRNFPVTARTAILDLLFSTTGGAGLSIVRNVVGDGGVWGTAENGPTPSIEPEDGQWNWNGDEDQIWFMREANARGCSRFMSTVWSPPAWMKTNHSVIQGRVSSDKYQAYAEYLSAYVRGYKEHHGIDLFAISPANEPEITVKYSSCYWTPEELHAFLRDALIPAFRRDRISAKVLLGESSAWSEFPVVPSLNDPLTAARVDIVGVHSYVESHGNPYPPVSERSGILPAAITSGKPIWNTEVSDSSVKNITDITDGIYWAKLLHTHVVEHGVTGWLYWWAISLSDNRGALIQLCPKDHAFVVPLRLYAIGNYSRFVRPGCVRLRMAPSPALGTYISAFKNAGAGQLIVVAINEGSESKNLKIKLSGPRLSQVRSYRTSSLERLSSSSAAPVKDNLIDMTLAGQSVTTFVAVT